VASRDGQVIENLRITSTSGPAIVVEGHSGVVIRNVQIRHAGGPGIAFNDAANLRIEDVDILHTGAPTSGANPSADLNNIDGYGTTGLVVTRVRLTRGSSGIYLIECPGARLSFVEGHDFRGPFPRGQVVQFNHSDGSFLEDFSAENPPGSWTEDNVSVWRSSNVTIRRGLVDGNNSPSGAGIMYELDDGVAHGGLTEDVDAVRQGNGCFSAYPGRDVTFSRVRARDNICGDQGRGAPLSNALVFGGEPSSTNLRILDSRTHALCNPGNLVWDADTFTTVQISDENFTPRAPLRLDFCFE
jgi:hypothetical protein